jgi:hypothetical protein
LHRVSHFNPAGIALTAFFFIIYQIFEYLGSPLLSDKYLKTNDYLEMNTNERDVYRIAFEGS